MNHRPWYARLLLNPSAFMREAFLHLYVRRNPNPTKAFGDRDPGLVLILNAISGTLNGIPLGSGLEKLELFGAADSNFGDETGLCLTYAPIGLAVSFDHEEIATFELAFDRMFGEHPIKFAPCKVLAVETARGGFELTNESTIEDLKSAFGEPYKSDISKYQFGIEHWFAFCADGGRIAASLDGRRGNLIHLELSSQSCT